MPRSVRASMQSAEQYSPPTLSASPQGLEPAGVHSVHRFRRHCRSLVLAGYIAYPARWCDPSAVEGMRGIAGPGSQELGVQEPLDVRTSSVTKVREESNVRS